MRTRAESIIRRWTRKRACVPDDNLHAFRRVSEGVAGLTGEKGTDKYALLLLRVRVNARVCISAKSSVKLEMDSFCSRMKKRVGV